MSTITREFTKEQLIAKAEERRDHAQSCLAVFPNDEEYAADKRLAEIALALLEAEPVSINDDMALAFHHALSDSSLGADDVEEIKIGLRAAFANVTAPPVPVSVPTFDEWLEIRGNKPLGWVKDAMRESYDACRAAMLQGAENAESRCSNSPVIPDGWVACSERMPEQFVEVLVCTEDGGRYVAALNQSMTWDDGDFFDDIQDVTHWQPLPSPPAK